jgi:2-succinyl-5-enolpyruvyl-6-hydroxy-3-cyclohexene-1-carboxylate synthase
MNAPGEALDVAVGALIGELGRAGVTHACACPGSRSTPLAIKLAEQHGVKLWMHLDERSAAYFALGLAKASRNPVILLATSGTAAANFMPAIVEARLARVPLVVLTADRPHELRDIGAPQTIDQIRLYGEHVKWFVDLPEPELSQEHLRLVRTTAARAAGTARAEPAGPVHVNWPFREPLVPVPTDGVWGARPGDQPYVAVETGRLAPSPELVKRLDAAIQTTERGLIVCGPQDDTEFAQAVTGLAARTGYPVLADALSGARTGPRELSLVIDSYDAFLRDEQTIDRLRPELVLRFGAVPTSKPLVQYLQRHPNTRQIVVDPGGWRDPTALASELLHADPPLLCESLANGQTRRQTRWTAMWVEVNQAAKRAMAAQLEATSELFEGKVFAELGRLLPVGSTLFAGNSMPVRDLDTFLEASAKALRCLSNRGANGIDGVVSTALGVRAAQRSGPVVLAIGDISFYHDLNGLLGARQYGLDLLVVLINNDGGGIFSFLPQSETVSDHFELLFGTPHGLDFRPFVEGYGGRFSRVADWSEFEAAVTAGLSRGGLTVVEVPTDRARNVDQHRAVWRAVSQALQPSLIA